MSMSISGDVRIVILMITAHYGPEGGEVGVTYFLPDRLGSHDGNL